MDKQFMISKDIESHSDFAHPSVFEFKYINQEFELQFREGGSKLDVILKFF